MASLSKCFKMHGIPEEEQARLRQLIQDQKDAGSKNPIDDALREAIGLVEMDRTELGQYIERNGGRIPELTRTLEPPEVDTDSPRVRDARRSIQAAIESNDDAAFMAASQELQAALKEQEGGEGAVTVTPEGEVATEGEQAMTSQEETDAEQAAIRERVDDPVGRDILDGKIPETAVDAKFKELEDRYAKEMFDYMADPADVRDPENEPTKPSRNRALEEVVDEVAKKYDEDANMAIRWAAQDMDASKNKAKKTKTGAKVERRQKGDVKWEQGKDGWVGKSIDGQRDYFISSDGRFKHTLYEVDKAGKQKEIGTYRSMKAASEAAADVGVKHKRGKRGTRFTVIDKATGKEVPGAAIKKGFLADQLIKELAENPGLNTRKRITELNKHDTQAKLKKLLEKEAAKAKSKPAAEAKTQKVKETVAERARRISKANKKKAEVMRRKEAAEKITEAKEKAAKTATRIAKERAEKAKRIAKEKEEAAKRKSEKAKIDAAKKKLKAKEAKIPKGKLTVDDPALQPIAEWTQALMNLFGMGNMDLTFSATMPPEVADATAATQPDFSNNRITYWLDPKKPENQHAEVVMEAMAHEVGHNLQFMVFSNASKQVRDEILNEYRKHLTDVVLPMFKDGDPTFKEIQRVSRSKALIEKSHEIFGDGRSYPARWDQENLGYLTSFEEWFADNVAKWAGSTKEPQSIAEQFFQGIAELLKAVYAAVKTGDPMSDLPNAQVVKFINRTVAKSKKQGHIPKLDIITGSITEMNKEAVRAANSQVQKDILGIGANGQGALKAMMNVSPDYDYTDVTVTPENERGTIEFESELTGQTRDQVSYFRGILTDLGIKSTNVVVVDSSDMPTFLEKQRKRGEQFTNLTFWANGVDTTADAVVSYSVEDNTIYLALNQKNIAEYSNAAQLEIIAHESGHIIERLLFHQSSKETRNTILGEYYNYLEAGLGDRLKANKISYEDFMDATQPFFIARDRKKMSPNMKNWDMFSAAMSGYLTKRSTFGEWFAENVAKWATTQEKPLTTMDKFFHKAATFFRKLYSRVKGIPVDAIGNKELNKWLDGMHDFAKANPNVMQEKNQAAAEQVQKFREKTDKAQLAILDTFSPGFVENSLQSELQRELEYIEMTWEASASLAPPVRARRAAGGQYIGGTDEALAYHEQAAKTGRSLARLAAKAGTEWRKNLSTVFESGIDAVGRISKEAERKLNRWTQSINMKNAEYKRRITPYMKEVNKLTKAERRLLGQLLYNNQREKIKERFSPQLVESLVEVDAVLEEIRNRADKVGLMIDKEIKNYYPRKVDDLLGMQAFLDGTPDGSYIEQEIGHARRRAKELGIEFTTLHEEEVVNSILQTGRYHGALRKPGSLKERGIEQLTPEMMDFYADPLASIQDHIFTMNDSIGTQEFLGGRKRKNAMAKLERLRKRLDKLSEGTKEYNEVARDYAELHAALADMKNETYLNESISEYLAREFRGSRIPKPELDKIMDIIRARAMERGINGFANSFRNAGLITTLGDFSSTITQMSEIILNVLRHGPKHALMGLIGKKEIDAAMFDLKRMQLEYQDEGSAAWVGKVLKMNGFAYMDIKMKEAFMQSSLLNARAKVDSKRFQEKWETYFGKEDFTKLQMELKEGKAGPLSQEMAWAELMRYQPLDTIANPIAYMRGGNWRIAYMLKTFQLRQMNALYRETIGLALKGDYKRAAINMAWMSSLIVMGGATKDEVRDFWLGRQVPFRENVYDNILNMFLFSRYDMDRAVGEGLGKQIVSKVLPPTNMIDHPIHDIHSILKGEPNIKSLTMLPVIGKIWYDRFTGAGREREYTKRKGYITGEITRDIQSNGRLSKDTRRLIDRHNKTAPSEYRYTVSAKSRAISKAKKAKEN